MSSNKAISNNKTLAREYAFKFLYQWSHNMPKMENEIVLTAPLTELLADFDPSFSEPDREHPDNALTPEMQAYGKKLIESFIANQKDIKASVKPFLKIQDLDKVKRVDLFALFMGSLELHYFSDVPRKVAINEAINLAKKFGGLESASFVNGVLDKIQIKLDA